MKPLHITNCSFQHLPFSKLFKTYVSDFSEVSTFYDYNPFDCQSIEAKAQELQYTGDRRPMVELLKDFNKSFELQEAAKHNLNRLEDDDALTLVTGQQLGVFGGPLYTVLKIISVIHLARQMEDRLDRPVIPVFWLADEDHDYDEVRSLHLLNKEELESAELPSRPQPLLPVAELALPDELDQLRIQIQKELYETDFSADVWQLLNRCFRPGTTFFNAFGDFVTSLFSKHGLVLAGSNHAAIKAQTKEVFKHAVENAGAIRDALEDQTDRIKEQFHQQVTLYDSNLFYFSDEGTRLKINATDMGWAAVGGHEWTTGELLKQIDKTPERFSPNVFLRPLLQDRLLPTLGYVAGPGELAYYGQMKKLYAHFNAEMPVIFPRMTATLVEPAINRILGELPFEFYEYDQRIEDLDAAYVERTEKMDIEGVFAEWKQKVEQISDPKKEEVSGVDPTLEGAAGKATAVYFGELDKLKGKVYRAVKNQDQTQLSRIRRIKHNLFPKDGLQERSIAAIYFMNKYGIGFWDNLLESLNEDETFDQHKLFEL